MPNQCTVLLQNHTVACNYVRNNNWWHQINDRYGETAEELQSCTLRNSATKYPTAYIIIIMINPQESSASAKNPARSEDSASKWLDAKI